MSLINRICIVLLSSAILLSVPVFATPEKEKISPAPDANESFTPLLLPQDAAQRGISLSGQTKMYREEQGHYILGSGCALIHTEEPIFISTCRAKVFARAGATIVVGAKKDATRVMNFSDRKHDSVRVIFGNNHVSLNPGEELAIVSSTAPNADKAANEYVIRYRNAQSIAVSPEYKAVLFEFSLADAMQHCLIFRQLRESPLAEDKQLLTEIIKTAAAVNTLYAKSRDKYTHAVQEQIAKRDIPMKLAARKKKQGARIALSDMQKSDN